MIYGVNGHWPSADQLKHMSEVGLKGVRVDFNWKDIEPVRGVYTWEVTDTIVRAAAMYGLEVYPTIAHPPAWWDLSRQPWWNVVSNCVRRYTEVPYWSLWNEPNAPGGLSASQYVNLVLEPGAQAIRAGGRRVCGPELQVREGWQKWLDTVLYRGGHLLDVVSVHCYKHTGRDVCDVINGDGPWWNIFWTSVHDVLEHGRFHGPLWLTETGWDSSEIGEDRQAANYQELLENLTGVDRLYTYQWQDEPGVSGGIVRLDGTEKPALDVYRRWIAVHGATV